MSHARTIALMALVGALALGGCTKRRSANIVQHPEWQYQDFKRIAVLPFKACDREAAEAAHQAESLLIDDLTANGSFTVLSRGELKDIMTEQDLSRLADVANPNTSVPEGMLQVAQAVVVGQIASFDLDQQKKELRRPRYAMDRKGRIIRDRNGQPRVVGEDVMVEYRNLARVAGNVRVIDVASGRVLLSYTVPPVEKDESHWNSPPDTSPEQLGIEVAQEIATAFYRKIAPQTINVKLGSDCLIVADEYYEGKYEQLKKVPETLDELLIVTRGLPKSCDRNCFRVAVSPRDGGDYIVEHEFTWSPGLGQRGEVLRVPLEKLRDSGGVQFTAKLFAVGNDTPMLARDFELVPPKTD
jgi:curli biogenesis system outer membrane secretion channel CsgG